MRFLGRPNIEKMAAENDRDGLYRCLQHNDRIVRMQAAQTLAGLNDGAGWRYLTDTLHNEGNPGEQETAASILGELGAQNPADARRAVPLLAVVLQTARGDLADTVRDALALIGSPEAEEALRSAGYAANQDEENHSITDFDVHFIRPVLPNTEQFEFLSAEQHLNIAVDLREAELAERGLVECSLALWLNPGWAYAWYLRGVLFEDLDRPFEAWLAYQRAIDLDPDMQDALEAADDLANEHNFSAPDPDHLLIDIGDRNWRRRRDAAAGIGSTGPDQAGAAVEMLMALLEDDEREVRLAAIHAVGMTGSQSAVYPLLARTESSWLLRFAVIEALSNLNSVDGLMQTLRSEMNRIQERNPVFSSLKDPLVEVEYDRLLEIGVLALERTGDIDTLLSIAEDNAWQEVDEDVSEYSQGNANEPVWDRSGNSFNQDVETGDLEEELDEDLDSYVDEAALMAVVALDRCAMNQIEKLPVEILRRLAVVPDLTLIDLTDEESVEPAFAVVHDLNELRKAAQSELVRRRV